MLPRHAIAADMIFYAIDVYFAAADFRYFAAYFSAITLPCRRH